LAFSACYRSILDDLGSIRISRKICLIPSNTVTAQISLHPQTHTSVPLPFPALPTSVTTLMAVGLLLFPTIIHVDSVGSRLESRSAKR